MGPALLYFSQVMHMDRVKTGQLIAEARKTKNLTQKDLAETLHVSDRAVSKWERGAGFPDVSLLEPLAAALDLNVLDLLRGERTEETDPHAAVSEALAAFQEKQRRDRRQMWKDIRYILLAILPLVLFCLYAFPLKIGGDRTVRAGVYRDGELASYTDVKIQGDIEHQLLTGRRHYWGRFAIGCVEWTGRDQMHAGIDLDGEYEGFHYSTPGMLYSDLYDTNTYVNRDLTEFAFELGEGYILASSPQAYEAYRTGYGSYARPPELTAEGDLPDFPLSR